MRLSGVGPIPVRFDGATRIIEGKPPQPLKPGEYKFVDEYNEKTAKGVIVAR